MNKSFSPAINRKRKVSPKSISNKPQRARTRWLENIYCKDVCMLSSILCFKVLMKALFIRTLPGSIELNWHERCTSSLYHQPTLMYRALQKKKKIYKCGIRTIRWLRWFNCCKLVAILETSLSSDVYFFHSLDEYSIWQHHTFHK